MDETRVSRLFNIRYPIIQAGMVWCSGWRLASAVSNAGALGLIGSGSMTPEILREHVIKCRQATSASFGVNVPLLYPHIDQVIQVIQEEGVKIVFTSAGNPATWTGKLKALGVKVVHVVSSTRFALKAEQAGADAVVAEGFEAGGHNGREETSTLCLVPAVVDAVKIPVIAAGGIATGRAILAMHALGAEAVQMGTRFAASNESSAHENFKKKLTQIGEGETQLTLKQLTPVRMIKNQFFRQVDEAERRGASPDELSQLLGKGRSKRGIFEGDLEDGELEIGQVSATIREIKPAAEIVEDLVKEFDEAKKKLVK